MSLSQWPPHCLLPLYRARPIGALRAPSAYRCPPQKANGIPMSRFAARVVSLTLPTLATAALLWPALGKRSSPADDPSPLPQGMAVTVLKTAKSCFSDIVEVSGLIRPREETAVRPERFGARVTDILTEPGEIRHRRPDAGAAQACAEGGSAQVQAPVAGIVLNSSAVIGRDRFRQRRGAVHHHRAWRIRP